jgi:hypothetical protein
METKEKKLLGLLLEISLQNRAMLETVANLQRLNRQLIQALPKDNNFKIQTDEELKSIFKDTYESNFKMYKSFLQFDLDEYLKNNQVY